MSEHAMQLQRMIAGTRTGKKASAVLEFADTLKARVLLVGVIAILAVVYILLVNSSSAASFTLTDLHKESIALESQLQKSQLEQTALRSLTTTEEETKDMNLVAAGKVQYVGNNNAVALAE